MFSLCLVLHRDGQENFVMHVSRNQNGRYFHTFGPSTFGPCRKNDFQLWDSLGSGQIANFFSRSKFRISFLQTRPIKSFLIKQPEVQTPNCIWSLLVHPVQHLRPMLGGDARDAAVGHAHNMTQGVGASRPVGRYNLQRLLRKVACATLEGQGKAKNQRKRSFWYSLRLS